MDVWLPLVHPPLGTWPKSQAWALTGNQTGDPLVHRPALNLRSHTSQGCLALFNFLVSVSPFHLPRNFPSFLLSCLIMRKAALQNRTDLNIITASKEALVPLWEQNIVCSYLMSLLMYNFC